MTTTPRVSTAIHQANLTDASAQQDPAIVDIGAGRYIVVWTQPAGGPINPSATSDLIGQIFDSADNRVGSEFRVNTVTIDNEQDAALASRPGGGFLMVYEGTNASGTRILVDTRDVNGAFVPGTPTTVAERPRHRHPVQSGGRHPFGQQPPRRLQSDRARETAPPT